MKALVAVADYPNDSGNKSMMFVHTRNKYYIQNDIDVTVLNFSATENYVIDGVKVITLGTYTANAKQYDVLICHAPNLRNHYIFLKKFSNLFKRKMFFFHGHEIVKIGKVYPKAFDFKRKSQLDKYIQSVYDIFKLKVWKKYFNKKYNEDIMVFVSESLKNDFLTFTGIQWENIQKRCYVINNSVGYVFEKKSYHYEGEKDYDFITIRSDIDNSVYCIDLIAEAANMNPDKKFLIIGKGKYFKYNNMPKNITHINNTLKQEELIAYINKSKVALMPTRRDSQGVMACELATYGIPVITSDLTVCKEMFSDFANVIMTSEKNIVQICKAERPNVQINGKCDKFFHIKTIMREIELIREVVTV